MTRLVQQNIHNQHIQARTTLTAFGRAERRWHRETNELFDRESADGFPQNDSNHYQEEPIGKREKVTRII